MLRDNTHQGRQGEKPRLVYIIGTYPQLTTTFIDREVDGLRRRDVHVQLVSIRRPSSRLSLNQQALQNGVVYLLPVRVHSLLQGHFGFALRRPATYFRTLIYLLSRPHGDLKSRVKTFLHFATGVYAAHVLRGARWDHIHAHFADRSATVAIVASRLLDLPYSFTAHANDIYVHPVLLPEKLSEARFVATCTAYNRDHLRRLLPAELADKVKCIYHGLDLRKYKTAGVAHRGKPLLLAVGQLKEKKGFSYLLEACKILKGRGYDFECQIVGDGHLRAPLQEQIRRLSLEGTARICGALPHQEVVRKYRRATILVLPSVLGADGDRDGIPNVILEAMAMQLPVVSTIHSGIPEVIHDGVNGLLVPPGDFSALAGAIARLLDDADLRVSLGKRGRIAVTEKFNIEHNVGQLLAEFTNPQVASPRGKRRSLATQPAGTCEARRLPR